MQKNEANGQIKPGLSLVRRPEPEPPQELVELEIWNLISEDLDQFVMHLEIAREYWRDHRELVEAPELHANLKALAGLPGGWSGELGADSRNNPHATPTVCSLAAELREKLTADPLVAAVVKELREEKMAQPWVVEHVRKLMRVVA